MLYRGRAWIEMLRVDKVELYDVFGLRFNVWTSIVLFVLGPDSSSTPRRGAPREEQIYTSGVRQASSAADAADGTP